MASELSEVNYDQDADAMAIRNALVEFARDHGRYRVLVFRSSGDHLRALIVSNHFDGMGASQRQNEIWTHLGTAVSERLFGVHPYSWAEYEREFVEQN